MVEFALLAPLAILIALAVGQFALFLYERNVVMGSLSEGVRVAASTGRSISDGQLVATKLLRESLGGRIAESVLIDGAVEDGLAVLRADATLPSFVPGVPGLKVHMTAAMHKEENLAVTLETQGPHGVGATVAAGGALASGGVPAPDGEEASSTLRAATPALDGDGGAPAPTGDATAREAVAPEVVALNAGGTGGERSAAASAESFRR